MWHTPSEILNQSFFILNIFKPALPQATQLRLLFFKEKQQRCASLEGPDEGHSAVDRRREKSTGPWWIRTWDL